MRSIKLGTVLKSCGVAAVIVISFAVGLRSNFSTFERVELQVDSITVLSGAGFEEDIALAGRAAPILLLIFSTECRACPIIVAEWREIVNFVEEKNLKVPSVFAVSVSSASDTAAFLEDYPMPDLQVVRSRGQRVRALGVLSYPATVLIEPPGRAAQVWLGLLPDSAMVEIERVFR